MTVILIFLSVLCHAQPVNEKPSITLHILKPDGLTHIGAFLHNGRAAKPFECGDDQKVDFDGGTDGVWTCKYIPTGVLGDTVRLSIVSEDIPYSLFDGLLTLPKSQHSKFGFLIKQSKGQWIGTRTSLHENHAVNNLMVTTQEWIVSVWSIIIVNIVGLMLWFSRKIN